jgi:phosphatidylinositol glycan class B
VFTKPRALKAFDDLSWTRAFIACLLFSWILHLLGSIFSTGYYHTDEHFQILEFLNYKLGRTSSQELAIEFGQKLRPWLQPAMDYVIARGMIVLGDTNPFHWAWMFRFISAMLGWLSLVGLSILSYSWFEDSRLRKLALLLVATLWYLPALHARHSSESMSGSLFYIAASLLFLFWEDASLLFHFSIGLLFGSAFEFRYQVAFLIIGAVTYYWIAFKPKFSGILGLAAGCLVMAGIGVLIDYWGYGEWTFTPWNYFHYNIVLNHVADVDTQPVLDFFRSSLTESFPPLGLLTLVSFVLSWVFLPFHLLTAISFPLYLVHSIIGHKELRFLFPIVSAGPFLILLSLTARHKAGQYLKKICFSEKGIKVAKFLFALNLIALVPSTFLPCWMPARFFSQLYDLRKTLPRHEEMKLYFKDKNPFEILGIPLYFYRPENTATVQLGSSVDLNALAALSDKDNPLWYFQTSYDLPADAGAALRACKPEIEALPRWISSVLRWKLISPLAHRVTDWTLFRCESEQGPIKQ